MPNDPSEYAEIQNVTKEECFDRWDGVDWTPYEDDPNRGICESDYDFDGWATEHEGGEEDE